LIGRALGSAPMRAFVSASWDPPIFRYQLKA
jgi:hypothetical protein